MYEIGDKHYDGWYLPTWPFGHMELARVLITQRYQCDQLEVTRANLHPEDADGWKDLEEEYAILEDNIGKTPYADPDKGSEELLEQARALLEQVAAAKAAVIAHRAAMVIKPNSTPHLLSDMGGMDF